MRSGLVRRQRAQRAFGPVTALGQHAEPHEQLARACRQLQADLGVACVGKGPVQRGANVGEPLWRKLSGAGRAAQPVEIEEGMTARRLSGGAALDEPRIYVLPRRVEQPVARRLHGRIRGHQRFEHELLERFDDVVTAVYHSARFVQTESADEHRQLAQ